MNAFVLDSKFVLRFETVDETLKELLLVLCEIVFGLAVIEFEKFSDYFAML